uniref:Uncharacterized protein n=1 Tax=viral metagenome TaxID=1070528 RepID=A0A6C0C8Y8_9ZZZZ
MVIFLKHVLEAMYCFMWAMMSFMVYVLSFDGLTDDDVDWFDSEDESRKFRESTFIIICME